MIPSIAVSLLKLGLAGPLAHPIEKKKVAAAELPHVTMKCSDDIIIIVDIIIIILLSL